MGNSLKHNIGVFFAENTPKLWISLCYFKRLHKILRWWRPKNLNEKIRWLQFNSDTSMWPLLTDKYRVREYISNLGYGNILRDLYGVWKSVEDVNFEVLPQRFVIRTNKSSGDTILVNKSENYDTENIRKQLRESLINIHGVLTVEPHYSQIDPVIIAEQYLDQGSILDYKFFCFNGLVHSLYTISYRNQRWSLYDKNVYSINWESMPNCLKPEYRNHKLLEKPKHLDEMLVIASELSRPFPFVRIDLYESNDKIYFGEFTFTPSAGMDTEFSKEYLEELGEFIKII